MAVIRVTELYEGRRAEDGVERKRGAPRRFEVETDDPNDDGYIAGGPQAGVLGLPRNGQSHPNDAGAFMIKIVPEQGDSPTLWYITCDYSTELPTAQGRESSTINAAGASAPTASGMDPTARPENPLDRPPVWKVGHEQTTEIAHFDKDGNAIVNSAGLPFNPPAEIERSYAVFTVTKNYATVDFDTLEDFVGAVNTNPFVGRAARTLRLLALEYEPASENGVNFWRATFRIKYKPGSWDGGDSKDQGQGWDLRVVDQGLYKRTPLDGGACRWDLIADGETGVSGDDPKPLDGMGQPLAPSTAVCGGTATNNLKHRTFKVYPQEDFSLLGLL